MIVVKGFGEINASGSRGREHASFSEDLSKYRYWKKNTWNANLLILPLSV